MKHSYRITIEVTTDERINVSAVRKVAQKIVDREIMWYDHGMQGSVSSDGLEARISVQTIYVKD